ncbi:FtsX-like permease family protein [Maribellus comscasis]|uniref:FtsX-like permease family protein n=1 Tax=Maribellus comscasis TaxID=2681766 RepID=A0A6I6JWZ5_9BACT|nr:ABC transporter permease [Maribellus comscasis]QGY44682.1 FtsX-like permease family protein [Maribellus comscasis]
MKYYLKFATANLKKSILTTGLNLAGLVSGFAAFILIVLYLWNEYHFDTYNKNAENIYRIEVKYPGNSKTSVFLFGPTGETLANEFPEITATTTYMPWGKWQEASFTWENNLGIVKEFEDYAYSDKMLTEIFTFKFISGKQKLPLEEPQTAIISKKFAQKAWGDDNPVGKQLAANGTNYTVSAVFNDLPENSVVTCPIILKLPATGWMAESAKGWDVTNYPQFVLVKPGTDKSLFNKKLNSQSIVKAKHNVFVNKGTSVELVARPLTELHFTDGVAETPIFSSKSKVFVQSLRWVGILILLVVLINYINFATANVPKRIKSVSISRIIGGRTEDVVFISLLETSILFIFSFLVAIALAYLVNKGVSNQILGYTLPFKENTGILILVGLTVLTLGLLAGIYPAVYSISGNPVFLLKGLKRGTKVSFRGVLTVSQFVTTIALIIASVTVIKQVHFMRETDLGFSKEQTLVIRLNDEIKKNIEVFKNKLNDSPFINDYAFSRAVPGQAQERMTFTVDGEKCLVWYWAADDNYVEMMDFKLLEGRQFIKNSKAEDGNLICNETAAKRYGWKVGQKINNGTLVGIIKDFNFVSLRESVEPFTFWHASSTDAFHCVSLKLNTNQTGDALQNIRRIYDEVSPVIPFRYYFMDDRMNELYTSETQQVKLITAFSFLSVIISILGILGLSVFLCQHKIKEIGVRKVNGARVSEILAMLNKDLVKWVLAAVIIATPISYYAMNKWIENYTYKTSLSWWIFALAGMLALGIALLTVSWQSWKAATKNPVDSLRYE